MANKNSRKLMGSIPDITKKGTPLPETFEQYFVYQEQSLQVSYNHIRQVRRILTDFHHYLSRKNIILSDLRIEHVDNFMTGYKVSQSTRRIYRYFVKGFLKYLYHEKRIIKSDLAQVLIGPPIFAQSRLPRFLQPQQVNKLFVSLPLTTSTEIRTYTMIHLAYSLGLRPVEISKLTLDDISFSKGEITIRERKNKKPVTIPIPKEAIKSLALYMDKGRPKGLSRHIFLLHRYPYRPVSAHMVCLTISTAMKKAGLPSTTYWLRHTYAQNLLSIGRSIYEVKEMLGHHNIQSTKRYLHINTELMRKVIFDEEL